MFQNFNIVFDYLLILTIFHVQNVLIIFNWCLCDFLVLKHIDEVYALHLHLSFHLSLTDVDIFLFVKIFQNFNIVFDSLLILTIFHVQNVLSFSTDVYVIFLYWNILMKCTHFIFICHWLMLTYFCGKMFQNFNIVFDYLLILTIFHVQNVLIIFNWCLCDFLVLKHIDEVHTLHLHLSFTDVDIFFVVKNVPEFQYCFWLFTDIDYFSCAKCSYHFQLMFMWFSCTETYWWSVCTSSSFVIYWCWHIFVSKMFQNFNIVFDYLLILTIFHVQNVLSFSTDVYVIFLYWNILMKCTHFIFICHWLMLTYFCGKMFQNFNIVFDSLLILTIFHVQNVLIIFNWCLCDFLVLKHIHEVHTLHLHLSLTDVDIFLCCKCSRISILFLIIYWFWLFFMCKMFLSFSTDVYVIFLYWNILMKCMHFIFICHLLMLTYFCVKNVPEFQYCFWFFTDIDYFSCAKCSYHFQLMFMWFSCTETYSWSAHTSSSFVIDWCWDIFVL